MQVQRDSVWGQLWEPFIKPALGFQTSKQVRLNDWRLGVCLRVAQLLVISYTVYDVVRVPNCIGVKADGVCGYIRHAELAHTRGGAIGERAQVSSASGVWCRCTTGNTSSTRFLWP
jgi:hypothetical protein